MFINNKYHYIYRSIINNSKNRDKPTVTERHHIIPKSLGGDNSKDNIAFLTPREHYICHRLLTKCTSGKDKTKMSYAFWYMNNINNYVINSRSYDYARSLFVEATSKRVVSQETRDKLSKKLKGRKCPWVKWPTLEHNGNAVVWDITTPEGKTFRLVGEAFTSFCKEHSLSKGNLSHHGKTKGFTAVKLGKYHDLKVTDALG